MKDNRFLPPFVARYVRIQPADFKLRAALRLELMGCDLNSEVCLQSEGCCFIAEKKLFVLFLSNRLLSSSWPPEGQYS